MLFFLSAVIAVFNDGQILIYGQFVIGCFSEYNFLVVEFNQGVI